MALITSDPPAPAARASPHGPEQGVIEEARRRQRRRRARTTISSLIAVALIGTIAWALGSGASHAGSGRAAEAIRTRPVDTRGTRTPAFNVRVIPTQRVGEAGWCLVNEEHGISGTSACGGAPTPSNPFLQVDGWGTSGSHHETQVAVSDPQVIAILVDSTRRVPTVPLPGLPYGLRGARVVTPTSGSTIVGLGALGQRLPEHWTSTPRQASVRSWRYPSQPAQGPCQLHASGLPGLSAHAGEVATTIRPFPGQLIGHAFVPCISTTYRLRGLPVKAMIMLDAAQPSSRAAALPDFKPVPRAPGFYFQGGLVARRSGSAWLIVGQGSGISQRMLVLRHLLATVKL